MAKIKYKDKFNVWYSTILNNKKRLVFALLFLIIAVTAYGLSGDYVSDQKNTAVSPDLILDNFGPYNLSFIFTWLFLIIVAIGIIYPLFIKPKKLPYAINMISLFILIRSGFILFTHLRPPSDAVKIVFPWFLQFLNFSNDLFFSGHAGIPFLGFLVFRKSNKILAYFMLICSIILGVTVLLMHVHYSIDVLSAYFITYGIYVIGNKIFKE